jgi:hypothetical protein
LKPRRACYILVFFEVNVRKEILGWCSKNFLGQSDHHRKSLDESLFSGTGKHPSLFKRDVYFRHKEGHYGLVIFGLHTKKLT